MSDQFSFIMEDEPLPPRNIVATIYGEPGVGKTSLAFTADKPILIDFDEGAERSVGRKATLKLKSWQGLVDFIGSDKIKDYGTKTLICDTADRMIKYMGQHAIKMNPVNAQSDGSLSLKGFGAVKNMFEDITFRLGKIGVDLVIIAHATTEKGDGDRVRFIPKITGGSYDILLAISDLVGYLEMHGDGALLDFNPTNRHYGKNSPQFKRFELPHFEDEQWPGFMGRIIQGTKDRMAAMNEAQAKAQQQLEELRGQITEAETMEDLDVIAVPLLELKPIYQRQVLNDYAELYARLLESHIEQEGIDLLQSSDWLVNFINGLPHDEVKRAAYRNMKHVYAAQWSDHYMKNASTADDFNALIDICSDLPKYAEATVKKNLVTIAQEMGFKFDAETKSFSGQAKQQAKPEAKPEPEPVNKQAKPEAKGKSAAPVNNKAPEARKNTVTPRISKGLQVAHQGKREGSEAPEKTLF